jgi:hypothetical protein
MTDHSAIRVEVKLYAERKNKDGRITSFVMHPNETPQELTDAPVGKRFYMSLLDADRFDETEGREVPTMSGEPEREPEQAPARARITLAQRAGMLCDMGTFQRYLYDNHMLETRDFGEAVAAKHAAIAVRMICGVKSRSEIIPGTPAGQAFEELHAKYTVWLRHPEVA